jgi:hypothetical protein
MSPRTVRGQNRHIVYYGAKAYYEYGKVIEVLFGEPNVNIRNVLTTIDSTARRLGFKLQRRKIEEKLIASLAEFAKLSIIKSSWESCV